jgi:hemoglobin-like flavoprotein
MPYRAVMAQRLRFLEIDESTVASLGPIKQSLDADFDQLLDRFYVHILKQPELRAMFSNKETMARAREAQKRYWLTHLFAKHFDAGQFEQAEKIAQAHLRIGLEPSWYMSGYCYMLNQFVELACSFHENDTANAAATIRALNKLVFLDMNTVIDMYLEAKNATMRDVLRRATVFGEDMTAISAELKNAQRDLQQKVDSAAPSTEIAKCVARLSIGVEAVASRLKKLQFEDRLSTTLHQRRQGLRARVRRLFNKDSGNQR